MAIFNRWPFSIAMLNYQRVDPQGAIMTGAYTTGVSGSPSGWFVVPWVLLPHQGWWRRHWTTWRDPHSHPEFRSSWRRQPGPSAPEKRSTGTSPIDDFTLKIGMSHCPRRLDYCWRKKIASAILSPYLSSTLIQVKNPVNIRTWIFSWKLWICVWYGTASLRLRRYLYAAISEFMSQNHQPSPPRSCRPSSCLAGLAFIPRPSFFSHFFFSFSQVI